MGCVPLLFLPSLPAKLLVTILFALILVLFLICLLIFRRYIYCALFGLIGFVWSIYVAQSYLDSVSIHIDKTLNVIATINSVNLVGADVEPLNKPYVLLTIHEIDDHKLAHSIPSSMLWHELNPPEAGQLWQLTVKTKVTHSYLNEGGFDSQRFAIANRRLLIGSVKSARLLNHQRDIRQNIVNCALPYLNLFQHKAILVALTFGERTLLSDDHKQTMYQTGTAHLLAISGMHISLVAMLGFALFRGVQIVMPQRLIHHWHPYLFSWLVALSYAYLTGLSPPTLRAILALSLWLICYMRYIYLSAWQMVLRVIALLLFIDPLMILSESFWLSCYAVICLVFISSWSKNWRKTFHHKTRYFWQLVHLQCLLTILLLPIQLFIFQGISQFSIIANVIAIPIISLITFPMILIALLCSLCDFFYGAILFWMIADFSLDILFSLLTIFNQHYFFVSNEFYQLSALGWIAIIAYRTGIWRHYFLSILALTIALSSPIMMKPKNQWRIDMLDVGHGLAVVISQNQSAILYDTGAKWQKSDAAEKVIMPFLRWHNFKLEGIIISHEHSDHIGGLATLKRYYPEAWLMSSSIQLDNQYPCVNAQQLNWHNLQINALWPNALQTDAFNDGSCVVKISNDNFSILLTGDLERLQEEQLIIARRDQLDATVLQVPHHGSNTSSSYPFLVHVKPQISLFSVARYNPWHLPANNVLARYYDLGYHYYPTSQFGQLSIIINPQNWQLKTMRQQINPRWYHDWFGGL